MRVKTSSKKKQALNLNVYRNLHFRSLSAQKNKFYELAKKLLLGVPPLGVITLHYEVCPTTKRRLDVMNVGSIVDKYFSDSLTEAGIIADDDYVNIPLVSFAFGGFVETEHVLVTITEIEPRKEVTPMRVLLDQNDIQLALTAYVETLNIPLADGVTLSVEGDEITAEITFLPTSDPVAETPKPKRNRGGRPAGSKNKPKETANVDVPAEAGPAGGDGGDPPAPEVEAEAPAEAEAIVDTPKVSAKNLFGGKESPSSEDSGEAEASLDTPPAAVTPAKGSIFDT